MKKHILYFTVFALIAVTLLAFGCATFQRVFTPDQLSRSASATVEIAAPRVVADTIVTPAGRSAWEVTKTAIDDFLPALDGDTIRIDDINEWFDALNADNSILRDQAFLIQGVVNAALALIPTDKIEAGDSVFLGYFLPALRSSLEALSRIIGDELERTAPRAGIINDDAPRRLPKPTIRLP